MNSKRLQVSEISARDVISCYKAVGFEWGKKVTKPSRELFQFNLDRLMTSLNIKNAELARRVGVTRAAVGRWREGYKEPSFETKDAIAKALGVPVQELFFDPTDERTKTTVVTPETALSILTDLVNKVAK